MIKSKKGYNKFHNGWKIISIIMLVYTCTAGLLMEVPRLSIVNESIRALYFHVPMWFGMVFLFFLSAYHAIRYLRSGDVVADILSKEFASTGVVYGALGIITGMIWANYTWGSPWHGDPKQNGAAVALLVYLAYFILRGSLSNDEQSARLGGVYNIFAFAAMIPLIFILPRMADSMHPGSGGNPGFNMYDLDNRMRMVFYPAVLGWILFGIWITDLRIRFRLISKHP